MKTAVRLYLTWLLLGALVAFLLLAWMPPARADCAVRQRVIVSSPSYAYPSVTYTPYKEVVVKKEVVLATPVAVYLPYPIAAAFYPGYTLPPTPGTAPSYPASPGAAPTPGAMPGGPAVASAPGADLRPVLEALDRINRRLDVLEGRAPGGPRERFPVQDPPVPGKLPTAGKGGIKPPSFFGPKCASCHQRGKESEGNGFVLLEADGSLAPVLTDRDFRLVGSKIYTARMPPKKDGKGNALEAVTNEEAAEWAEFSDNLK